MRHVPFALMGIVLTATSVQACGLKGAPIKVGTPVQELTISGHDRPTMGFGRMQSVVTTASVVAMPCHGSLTTTRPLGFRYVPSPGFSGVDFYAVQGCLAPGRCDVTAAIVTVKP